MRYQKLVVQLLVGIVELILVIANCDDKIASDKLLIDAIRNS